MHSTLRTFASIAIACLILGGPAAIGEINPYQRTYVGFGLARNYPVSFSENTLQPGRASPTISYLYNLDAHWILGVSAQFKVFQRTPPNNDDSDLLGFLNVSHQTLYSIRLSHPMYLLTGPKILYLLPTTNARLPIRRSEDYRTEVGIAASAAIVRVIDQNFMAMLYFDRWRGTASMKLHALEAGLSVAVAIH